MATDKPESVGFLAVIDAKIAALQQLRESFIAAMSVGALGQDVDTSGLPTSGFVSMGPLAGVSGGKTGPVDLPTGVFRDKGLADAIRLYLSIAKRKQTLKEIASALQEGGLATTADNFEKSLEGTLYRLKNAGELLKFKEGWDLAASYPESFRQRLAQASEGATKPKKKAKKKAAAAKAAKPQQVAKPAVTPEPVLKAV